MKHKCPYKYKYPLSDLIDRLTIVQLKAIRIPEYKKQYDKEIQDILNDINLHLKEDNIKFDADMLHAVALIMLTNNEIWNNESKARAGGSENDKLLKLTHSINGQRNTAKNTIAQKIGDRKDLKIDCLAAEFRAFEFTKTHGNWDLYENKRNQKR